jgi:hypothetical protein
MFINDKQSTGQISCVVEITPLSPSAYLVLYFSCMLHACYLLFILCLCMSVKSSTELMLYVVLTMPTLNKAYLFIYLFIYYTVQV